LRFFPSIRETELLAPAGGIPTGGKEPRHFAIDPSGKYLAGGEPVLEQRGRFQD